MAELCHCGKPLHYTDPVDEMKVRGFIEELGECMEIQTPAGRWVVPRHYIALHGLTAEELPHLGFEKIE
jgi:hypothetical protein